MQHISTFKRIEFKAKSKKPIELIRFFCLVTMTKNIYLKMDKVGYQIFINKTY